MDWIAYALLFSEGLLAFWLLTREGLTDSRGRLVLAAVGVLGAFALRALSLGYETQDYQLFLSRWVDFYRENGGFRSFAYPLGNYNIPYLYFLCFFSYLPIRDLFLIKLLSCLFDVLLAFAGMKLTGLAAGSRTTRLSAFLALLYMPTAVLNGAVWGQCDSIYVSLALLGLWLGLRERPVLSVLCFTLSFGFKLQAVFLLPVMGVLWFRGNYKLWHFALFPAFYVLLVLPAVALGKPFLDTLTLYASQTGSIGEGLNYNSPSIYALFWRSPETKEAASLGIAGAFTFMLLVLLFCFFRRRVLTERAVMAAALLFAAGIPFFLPHMHDRYFFGADALSLTLAFLSPVMIPAALLQQYASLLSYHAYLRMRFLLYVDHGARAVIGVLLLAAGLLLWETAQAEGNENLSKAENTA